jgi:hypothetical protein
LLYAPGIFVRKTREIYKSRNSGRPVEEFRIPFSTEDPRVPFRLRSVFKEIYHLSTWIERVYLAWDKEREKQTK